MRRVILALGVVCAVAVTGRTIAQNSSRAAPQVGAGMPGQVVGTAGGTLSQVGQRAPAAAPQAGGTFGGNGNMRPFDPNRPYDMLKGTNIDPSTIVTPLVGPDGKPVDPPDALDRLSERIRSFFVKNPTPPRSNTTPGMLRRNRERSQERAQQLMWRRD